jgi:phosphoglycolate phosphatase
VTDTPPILVVFDVDGTLVDSQHMIFAAMAEAYRAVGLAPPEPAAVRHIVGLSLVEAMASLLPDAGAETHHDLAEHYKAAFGALRRQGAHEEPLFPGAGEAVRRLAADGYLLGVATGKSRRGLLATLDRFALRTHFHTLQTSDDAPSKPHPAMLERAMAETGAVPARTVLVGDTSFDMEMAANARVAAIGVAWGNHSPEDLMSTGAGCVLSSFAELDSAIEALIESG